MRKVYYIYNPKTRTYDRIYPTVRQRALSILRRLFVGMGLGAGSFIILLLIFGSPSEKELRIENTRLLAQYNVLSHRLDEAMGVMQDIQQRDDNLYRVVLQADPVSDAVRKAGYGGTNRYEQLRDMANADLVINTTQKLDMLNRQLYIQSKSFDEVVDLCKNHDEMLKCIPAIMPVSNKNLKKTASGYGVRIDPIYKTAKFHAGMDFSANIGTPVYATGDGTVVKPFDIHIMKKERICNTFEGKLLDATHVEFLGCNFECTPVEDIAADTNVKVEIDFEKVILQDNEEDGTLTGEVKFILYKGDHYHLTVLSDWDENVFVDTNDVWDDGDRVGITIPPDAIRIIKITD